MKASEKVIFISAGARKILAARGRDCASPTTSAVDLGPRDGSKTWSEVDAQHKEALAKINQQNREFWEKRGGRQ